MLLDVARPLGCALGRGVALLEVHSFGRGVGRPLGCALRRGLGRLLGCALRRGLGRLLGCALGHFKRKHHKLRRPEHHYGSLLVDL